MYRACERFGILPPGAKGSWDDCHVNSQAELIAYGQIRDLEDNAALSRMFS